MIIIGAEGGIRMNKYFRTTVFLLLAILLLFILKPQKPILLGDVNNDKIIDHKDVELVQQHLLYIKKINKKQQIRADMNFDGEVTLIDLLKIHKYTGGE